MLNKIGLNKEYINIDTEEIIETIEFKTIEMIDDSYQSIVEAVIYIGNNSKLSIMSLDDFSKVYTENN